MLRIAINGFGRIGRSFFRAALSHHELDIVAINDLADVENLAYLLKYDSAYGKSPLHISADKFEHKLHIEDREIPVFAEKDPAALPWKDMRVDVVVESTGFFTEYAKAAAHLQAGAKRVVISAPAKGEAPEGVSCTTALMGVNEEALRDAKISSNASCTTNAISPLLAILGETIGIEKALLNTAHAYTATQSLVDGPAAKDFRRGRAAAANIIPATTGAAEATGVAFPHLAGKFDGLALRVPTLTGSIADVTFLASRETSVEEVNDILRKAASEDRWKNLFAVTDEALVSSDIVGETHASIADLSFTRVTGGNLVKVLAWYDNESGYSNALVGHVVKVGSFI